MYPFFFLVFCPPSTQIQLIGFDHHGFNKSIPTPALLESPDKGARPRPFEVNTNRYKSFPVNFDRLDLFPPLLHPVKEMRSHDCSRFFNQFSSGSHPMISTTGHLQRCKFSLSWEVGLPGLEVLWPQQIGRWRNKETDELTLRNWTKN